MATTFWWSPPLAIYSRFSLVGNVTGFFFSGKIDNGLTGRGGGLDPSRISSNGEGDDFNAS